MFFLCLSLILIVKSQTLELDSSTKDVDVTMSLPEYNFVVHCLLLNTGTFSLCLHNFLTVFEGLP